jgi:hypothetical protein
MLINLLNLRPDQKLHVVRLHIRKMPYLQVAKYTRVFPDKRD